jgi:protocatechuate 3,4-dioxygenase beta subunit
MIKYSEGNNMPTYPTYTKIISSDYLCPGKIYTQNFKFVDSNRTLIKGRVLDYNGNPMEGIGIEVVQIEEGCSYENKLFLGVVFSEENGAYAVSVEVKEGYYYLLNIYSKLPS